MKFGGYRVRPNSLRPAKVKRRPIKDSQVVNTKPSDTTTVTNELEKGLESKIDSLFSGQELLFERLHSEPKWHHKAYRRAHSHATKATVYVRKQPVLAKVAVIAVPLALLGFVAIGGSGKKADDIAVNEVAGVADSSQTTGDVKPGVTPSFSMLLPKGKSESSTEFAKISPEGSVPVYAFIDQIGGTTIKVSEQELPDSFKNNQASELEKVAKNFQATDVIQVDETTVYHGVSEKLKTQSLVFIKKDRLVLIASPDKLTDETWVGYVASLE